MRTLLLALAMALPMDAQATPVPLFPPLSAFGAPDALPEAVEVKHRHSRPLARAVGRRMQAENRERFAARRRGWENRPFDILPDTEEERPKSRYDDWRELVIELDNARNGRTVSAGWEARVRRALGR